MTVDIHFQCLSGSQNFLKLWSATPGFSILGNPSVSLLAPHILTQAHRRVMSCVWEVDNCKKYLGIPSQWNAGFLWSFELLHVVCSEPLFWIFCSSDDCSPPVILLLPPVMNNLPSEDDPGSSLWSWSRLGSDTSVLYLSSISKMLAGRDGEDKD